MLHPVVPTTWRREHIFQSAKNKKKILKKAKMGTKAVCRDSRMSFGFSATRPTGNTETWRSRLWRRKPAWDLYFNLLHFSQAVWPWASHLISLNLSCFFCKIKLPSHAGILWGINEITFARYLIQSPGLSRDLWSRIKRSFLPPPNREVKAASFSLTSIPEAPLCTLPCENQETECLP